MGLGFAPPARDALKAALLKQGFSRSAARCEPACSSSAMRAAAVDRFRNRLMIPICRDTGSVIAFGGRAVDADQQPKYLNSPETPIYSKGRTLYGLDLSKAAIRQRGFGVLVEGYFDFASGVSGRIPRRGVVRDGADAAAGPAAAQVCTKVVLSFDPDAAGQGAAAKSCEMLRGRGV